MNDERMSRFPSFNNFFVEFLIFNIKKHEGTQKAYGANKIKSMKVRIEVIIRFKDQSGRKREEKFVDYLPGNILWLESDESA